MRFLNVVNEAIRSTIQNQELGRLETDLGMNRIHAGGIGAAAWPGTSRQGQMCRGRRVWKQCQGTPAALGVGGGGGARGH